MEIFIPITLFLSVAAVLILRPMTSKMGVMLEAMSRERMGQPRPADNPTDARIVALLEQMSRRLDHIEERVDFTERLVAARPTDDGRTLPRRAHAQVADY